MLHRKLIDLEAGLEQIRLSPKDEGRLELIVRRPIKGQREVLIEGELSLSGGLVGDCWKNHDPHPDMQINIMNARAIGVIAGDRQYWPPAGDQLFVDLDLSEANMPPGTRLALGSAILEITDKPHTGCSKFAARFGVEAAKFVNSPSGRALNLRGRNARVAKAGIVRGGDVVRKVGIATAE